MTVNPSRLDQPRAFLRALFDAALHAADPARALPPRLPPPPRGRTVVVGAGKAAAAMAKAVEQHWRGPLSGLVITRYGHAVACPRIEVVEASHPVPDAAGGAAAARILEKVRGLTADDLVLVLASGGGSALMALPAPGLALDDKRAVTRVLLRSGATIGEINCVRKHLSAIKGGRLAAAAAPAHVVTLAISDVPGDDPAVIASGPTVPDPSTFAQARAILAKYAIDPPAAIAAHLAAAAEETPKPGDARLARSEVVLIATPQDALAAAAAAARAAGVTPLVLGDAIEGEARDVALVHAGFSSATLRCRARRCCCRAARRPSRCVDRGAAGAMRSSCSPSPWRSIGIRRSMHSPPTPTASTARKTMPGPSMPPIRCRGPRRSASICARALPTMTATAPSTRSATCLSPGQR